MPKKTSNSMINFDAFAKILPVDKLVDVISKGIGTSSKSWLDRKDIKSQAIGIETLTAALNKAGTSVDNIQIEQNGVKITASKSIVNPSISEEHLTLIQSSVERGLAQLIQRQTNTEKVLSKAYSIVEDDNEPISEEPVNQDWINRFFRTVEDVSDNEMSELWAHVLAGEVKRPKSFSLRTLEVLKNLSSDDASKFKSISTYALVNLDSPIVTLSRALLHDEMSMEDMIALEDAGLLNLNATMLQFVPGRVAGLTNGNVSITVNIKPGQVAQFEVYTLTRAGRELLKLTNSPGDMSYFQDIVFDLNTQGAETSFDIPFGQDENGNWGVIDGN